MKKFSALILFLLTAACSGPAPHFFQLMPVQSAETVYPDFKERILISPVLLPAEQARPQITTLGKENYQVNIDEFNRWSASPERLIQQTLNDNLSILLPHAAIENQTTLRKNYKYAVVLEIRKINGRLGENAVLNASYFIRNKSGSIVRQRRFDKTLTIEAGYDEYIPAQSRLLGELSGLIAEDLVSLK